MNKASQKNFFLISFLPAIAYWYLEENYPLKIALAGGLLLAILEISLEWFFTKHVHTISKFNFYLILVLGGISFLGDDGIWFKLQPAFTGVGIGAFLIYRTVSGKGLMIEMMETMNPEVKPLPFMPLVEKHISLFFFLYGIFMAYVAFSLSTDKWLFFKTIGFYIATGVFFIVELIYLRFFWRMK